MNKLIVLITQSFYGLIARLTVNFPTLMFSILGHTLTVA